MPNEPIPLTLLTGFLGSGKTTLLNRLLRQPVLGRCAVVINELGAIGLDHLLVSTTRDETVALLENGCLCCSVRGELATTIADLLLRRDRGEIPAFERLVVETTGLARPGPVISLLLGDEALAGRLRLDGVVATVDAKHGASQLTQHEESRQQVACADRLLLTKCDLIDANTLAELEAALDALNPAAERILVHEGEVDGPLAMVQAVADRGRLIAWHANLRVKEGVGGGAAIKQSVAIPGLAAILERLAAALEWHGGLSMDAILTDGGPMIIDVNPRLVEPANAFFAGVDLVGAMLDCATGGTTQVRPAGCAGVLSHQSLLAILGAAERTGSRRAVAREAIDALFLRRAYRGSQEELTPIAGDPIAAIPVLAALLATIVVPSLGRKFYAGSVGAYAVTPQAWKAIVASADS